MADCTLMKTGKTMNFPRTITLCNRTFSGQLLTDRINNTLADESIDDWEKSVYRFIAQWISPTATLELKTSGSTGEPKTITVKKEWMIASALSTQKALNLHPGMSALLCLPIEYVAAKMFIVRAFVSGLNLHLVKPDINPMAAFSGSVDFTALTPPQVDATMADGHIDRIKKLIVGGAALSEKSIRALQNISTAVIATYGMTETLTHVALRRINGPDRSPWYTALDGVAIRSDERGCLVISAPRINPEPVVTNDLCEFDTAGRFKILGRIDNVINSGGLKIQPEIIENKIRPLIEGYNFFIGAIADERFGERPALFIEGLPDKVTLPDLSTMLSSHEMPASIMVIPRFLYTASGKLVRKETSKLQATSLPL